MTTIVTRASKGSPLSWSEADANFTNLNDDKAEVSVVALKAPLASPNLTGVPTAPTATNGTNTTQLATTAFVQEKTATQTPSTAVGTIVATNVQAALAELDTEKAALAGATFSGQVTATKLQTGVSGTNTHNFLLDASAADGTMKLGRGNGQDIMTVDAVGKVAFPQNAQTWQDVTVSRVWGTDFTNNTGQPIMVSCWFNSNPGTNLSAYGGVAGVQVSNVFIDSTSPTSSTGFSFIVPAGAVYSVVQSGASVAVWMELRN